MRIILSPAKQMRTDNDSLTHRGLPVFLPETEQILSWLKSLSYAEAKALWGCIDKLAQQNYERIAHMELLKDLTPAILAYDGIAFQYMAPGVFEADQFDYVQEHLRILSGFYGVLKPMDGVTPYRLEMQAKAAVGGTKNLYAFWGRKLYDEVLDDSRVIINLASKEYSRCVEPCLTEQDRFVTCIFAEEEKGKPVQKGVYAKMARGEMVRYMAVHRVEQPEQLKGFDALHYRFHEELSNEQNYVFLRHAPEHEKL